MPEGRFPAGGVLATLLLALVGPGAHAGTKVFSDGGIDIVDVQRHVVHARQLHGGQLVTPTAWRRGRRGRR